MNLSECFSDNYPTDSESYLKRVESYKKIENHYNGVDGNEFSLALI